MSPRTLALDASVTGRDPSAAISREPSTASQARVSHRGIDAVATFHSQGVCPTRAPVSNDRTLSRRDFLRLRRTEVGKVVEVSCHALFMRLTDAGIMPEVAEPWEPWMGEPPAVFDRPSVSELVEAFEHDLRDAQVLRLLDAEWLEHMPDASRVHAVIAAFRARGGTVELTNRPS